MNLVSQHVIRSQVATPFERCRLGILALTGLSGVGLLAQSKPVSPASDTSEISRPADSKTVAATAASETKPLSQLQELQAKLLRVTSCLDAAVTARSGVQGELEKLDKQVSAQTAQIAEHQLARESFANGVDSISTRIRKASHHIEILRELNLINSIQLDGLWATWYLNTLKEPDSLGVTRDPTTGQIDYSEHNRDIAVKHYLTDGVKACAPINPFFNPKFYLAKYPDVATSCPAGLPPALWAMNHWRSRGAVEGRQGSEFYGGKVYLENNPEVAEVVGTDYELALRHFVSRGIFENRAPSNEAKELMDARQIELRVGYDHRSLQTVLENPTDSLFSIVYDVIDWPDSCGDAIKDLAVTTGVTAGLCTMSLAVGPAPCIGGATSLVVEVGQANVVCVFEELARQSEVKELREFVESIKEGGVTDANRDRAMERAIERKEARDRAAGREVIDA